MIGVRALLVGAVALVLLGAPASVAAAAGPAPSEACVPGTVWEDPASGVKYLCVYDEVYGGPRWVLLSDGQRGASGTAYRSTVDGCLHLSVGLSARSGGGATRRHAYRHSLDTSARAVARARAVPVDRAPARQHRHTIAQAHRTEA